jgi:hypothetical protein
LTVSSKKGKLTIQKMHAANIFYVIRIGLVNPVLQVQVLPASEGAVA